MLEPNNIGIRCEIGVDLRREVTLPDIRLTFRQVRTHFDFSRIFIFLMAII